MNTTRLSLIAIAVLVAATILGAAWPPPPLPRLNAESSEWTLAKPPAQGRHDVNDMRKVTSDMSWLGAATAAGGQASKWRLSGIVSDQQPAALVVVNEGNSEPQRLGVGATLPDGSSLVSINGDRIQTLLDGCTTTYQLFRSSPVATSGRCNENSEFDQGISE